MILETSDFIPVGVALKFSDSYDAELRQLMFKPHAIKLDLCAFGEIVSRILQRKPEITRFPDDRSPNNENDQPVRRHLRSIYLGPLSLPRKTGWTFKESSPVTTKLSPYAIVSFPRLTHFLRGEFDEKNGVAETKQRLAQYIRSKHANKKTEIQFWLDIEEILSCYKNVRSRQWNLSSIWSDFQCGFGKCPQNHFTTFPGSRLPITWAMKDNQRSITGNMFSQMDDNDLHWSNRNVSRHPEFHHDYTYDYNQHMRKEIVRCLSSFVVSTIVFLGISYNIWNNHLSTIHVPPLQKEQNGRLSVWSSLLGLFGFMMFVCAVAVMVLVAAPFTSMQKAMLIFFAILMHLQSANSIIEVFVTLVGGLSMGWYCFGKKQPPNEVI